MLIQVKEQLIHTDFSFVPFRVISVRGKNRFTLRKFSWSRPQPKNYIKNTAIWNRLVSRSLNSLNENLEPKKSQWVSGCTKEHPEFQKLMRNLFQAYPVRHSSKVQILIPSKARILSLGCMLETPGELLKMKRPGLYPRLTEPGTPGGIKCFENSPNDHDPQWGLRTTALKPCYSKWRP